MEITQHGNVFQSALAAASIHILTILQCVVCPSAQYILISTRSPSVVNAFIIALLLTVLSLAVFLIIQLEPALRDAHRVLTITLII